MNVLDRALSDAEWWRLIRYAEAVRGDGPLTGLPLASVHPSVSELIRVRDLAALWLMGHCGLRVGELVKLPWEAVWADGAVVTRIEVGSEVAKGSRPRVVGVDSFVLGALGRLRVVADGVLGGVSQRRVLGCGPSWRAIGVRGVQRKVSELGLASLGRPVGCHQLRHTFAVRIRRRSDIAVCQRLLGHACLSSTAVYAGVTADECDGAVMGLSV